MSGEMPETVFVKRIGAASLIANEDPAGPDWMEYIRADVAQPLLKAAKRYVSNHILLADNMEHVCAECMGRGSDAYEINHKEECQVKETTNAIAKAEGTK